MKRLVVTGLVGLALLAGGIAGCGGKAAPLEADAANAGNPAPKVPDPVLIFAAASTLNAIDEIKAQFRRTAGVDVITSYAASSTLAEQIVHGADADIFLSADAKWAGHVASSGMQSRRCDLLGNRLVIIVPADSTLAIHDPSDLAAQTIEHLAVGDPASVPAGKYAKLAMEKLGIWEKLKDKIVAGADVRQALAYVETGAAEAGIVYATDAAIGKKVKVAAEISENLTGPVRYPLVLLKHGEGAESAESFYRYLASPEAAAVFKKYGFVVLQGESDGKP